MTGLQAQIGKQKVSNASSVVSNNAEQNFYQNPLGTTIYVEKHDEILNKVVAEPVVSWGTDATWKGERNATAAAVTTIMVSGVGIGGIAYGINQIAKGDGLMKGVGAASVIAGGLAIASIFPRAINANQVNPWA